MRNMKEFYQNKYRGSLFVIKAGGRVITDDTARRSLLENIKDLTAHGMKILLIYGGGHAIDEALLASGIEPRKVEGRRITGPDEMEVIKTVMSADLSYRISQSMAELDLHGFCLSNLPPAWINIAIRPRQNPKDEGYDGTIREVYSDQVRRIFEAIPFVATPCISVSNKNGVNINADNVAVAIAAGTQARKLIFLSDVDGVQVDGKTASFITDKEIPELIANGTVTGGMQVKLENCLHAMNNGVNRIHLLDGFRTDALKTEIYETEGPATMIIKEDARQAYLNEIQAEKAIAAQY